MEVESLDCGMCLGSDSDLEESLGCGSVGADTGQIWLCNEGAKVVATRPTTVGQDLVSQSSLLPKASNFVKMEREKEEEVLPAGGGCGSRL